MMSGREFPISDYYKENIIDAETISRAGSWWTAVLLITDPKTKEPFIGLYKWQKTSDGWKVRKKFSIKLEGEMSLIMDVINRLIEKNKLRPR